MDVKMIRVACFIDGFNLYHAVHDLRRNELKWLNLRKLMEHFIDPKIHEIVAIYYFSAFAEWLPAEVRRHKAYVEALKYFGVTPVMGRFKEKELSCNRCDHAWTGHEEKQSDVNIAIWMVREAFRNMYDETFLVTQDSDLAPVLEFINEMPKKRRVKIIGSPARRHSKELYQLSAKQVKIQTIHLERSLLPEEIKDAKGNVIVKRPKEYDPPSS
jgi:uncharacterized LabA/DUF88 family protein